MKRLVGCPCAVQLFDLFEDRDHAHLVMELCTGSDLRRHLRAAGGALPEAEAVLLLPAAAEEEGETTQRAPPLFLRQKQENLAVAAEDAADRRLLQDHYHDLHHLYTLD